MLNFFCCCFRVFIRCLESGLLVCFTNVTFKSYLGLNGVSDLNCRLMEKFFYCPFNIQQLYFICSHTVITEWLTSMVNLIISWKHTAASFLVETFHTLTNMKKKKQRAQKPNKKKHKKVCSVWCNNQGNWETHHKILECYNFLLSFTLYKV